jgi:hypothetical protein
MAIAVYLANLTGRKGWFRAESDDPGKLVIRYYPAKPRRTERTVAILELAPNRSPVEIPGPWDRNVEIEVELKRLGSGRAEIEHYEDAKVVSVKMTNGTPG